MQSGTQNGEGGAEQEVLSDRWHDLPLLRKTDYEQSSGVVKGR